MALVGTLRPGAWSTLQAPCSIIRGTGPPARLTLKMVQDGRACRPLGCRFVLCSRRMRRPAARAACRRPTAPSRWKRGRALALRR